MACEKLVIETNVFQLPQVLRQGETGILLEPGNSEELTRAMVHLLENPSDGRKLGRKALSEVTRKYPWDAFANQLDSTLKAVLS